MKYVCFDVSLFREIPDFRISHHLGSEGIYIIIFVVSEYNKQKFSLFFWMDSKAYLKVDLQYCPEPIHTQEKFSFSPLGSSSI